MDGSCQRFQSYRETIRYLFHVSAAVQTTRMYRQYRHRCREFIGRSVAINNLVGRRGAERSPRTERSGSGGATEALSRPMHKLDISRVVPCSTPPVYLSVLVRKTCWSFLMVLFYSPIELVSEIHSTTEATNHSFDKIIGDPIMFWYWSGSLNTDCFNRATS